MKMEIWPHIFVATICAGLSGRSTHRPPAEPSPISHLSYIGLQPGWRIRVVAPILKSGGHNVPLEEVSDQNGTIVMKTGKDFEGYETDYYDVRAINGLLEISFRSGEIRRNEGSWHNASHAPVSLFDLPKDAQYVRRLFLTRSRDQAILTASSHEQLDLLTNRVQSSPVRNCMTQSETSCIWAPEGVAVRPEKKQGGSGRQRCKRRIPTPIALRSRGVGDRA